MAFALIVAMTAFFLVSLITELTMRIRLTRLEVRSEKLSWWGLRGGDEVAATYKEVFPGSRLPIFRGIVFWVFLGCAVAGLAFIILRRG